MRAIAVAAVLVVLGQLTQAQATPRECEDLKGAQKQLATSILNSAHPYACCDRTLSECLKQRPVCRLVRRLAASVCRRVKAGQDRGRIERALARRATSMMPTGRKYAMDLSKEPVAGDPNAKVKLVAVTCPRCPYCAVLIRGLYREITQGVLKGKVRMQARLFPLRSHPGSTEGSMAVMAAKEFGKFWPYLIHLYKNFDHFDPKKLPECAASQGMKRQRFERLLRDKKLRAQLVASKKEGVRNAIEATPTLFINGRRYQGELGFASVVDVLEEEYDRVTGKK